MNVGDKVIADGKPTEITATAFDDLGVQVYTVKGSMKDYYEEELDLIKRPLTEREKRIVSEVRKVQKLRREQGCKFLECGVVLNNTNLRIEIIDLKRKMREQEKTIELMAEYVDIGDLSVEEIIEHFTNKASEVINNEKKRYRNHIK